MKLLKSIKKILYENIYVRLCLTAFSINTIYTCSVILLVYYFANFTGNICNSNGFMKYVNRLFFEFPVTNILCNFQIIFVEYPIQYKIIMVLILILLILNELKVIVKIELFYLSFMFHYSIPDSQIKGDEEWDDYLRYNDSVYEKTWEENKKLTLMILIPIIGMFYTYLLTIKNYILICFLVMQIIHPIIVLIIHNRYKKNREEMLLA